MATCTISCSLRVTDACFQLRLTVSHRTWQDLKEATPGKESPALVRLFLQSSLGLGFLSQYDQKSISILNVYTLKE